MISLKCSQCNAELLPDAKFCRRCGSVVTAEIAAAVVNSSELPTAMLEPRGDLTTQDLKPRVTSPETPRQPFIDASAATKDPVQMKRRRSIVIGSVAFVLLLCGILASVAYLRNTSDSGPTEDATLMYPGARTIVDVASGDGRSIHLQTDDSQEQVVTWYETFMKPTKTMRLTSTSIVLKKEKVTTTIATENGKTNILIKRVK